MIDNDYFVVWYVLRAGGVRFSGHGAQTGIEDSVRNYRIVSTGYVGGIN